MSDNQSVSRRRSDHSREGADRCNDDSTGVRSAAPASGGGSNSTCDVPRTNGAVDETDVQLLVLHEDPLQQLAAWCAHEIDRLTRAELSRAAGTASSLSHRPVCSAKPSVFAVDIARLDRWLDELQLRLGNGQARHREIAVPLLVATLVAEAEARAWKGKRDQPAAHVAAAFASLFLAGIGLSE
jgi:hypothetical protein